MLKEGKVVCITGDLGGGKSAEAIRQGFEHACTGGTVFTQIKVYPEEWAVRMRQRGLVFDPERLRPLSTTSVVGFEREIQKGSPGSVVMVILDEAQIDFTAAEKEKWEAELLVFLAMCRKLRIHCVFICHNMMELKIGIRRKITTETVCRNLKEEKIAGLGLPFDLYFVVSFKVLNGVTRHKLNAEHYFSLPAWGLYDSYALLGSRAEEFDKLEAAKTGQLQRYKDPNERHWSVVLAACIAAFVCML
jgi:hypothetical protein